MEGPLYTKNKPLSSHALVDAVRLQYEAFPYPRHPLLARISARDTYPLNYSALSFAAHGSTKFYRNRPRILVAGCGTFEACAVALANPGASILAVDLSQRSLSRLRWHRLVHGLLKRIQIQRADFLEMAPRYRENFDAIYCTGVLHHLADPRAGLKALHALLAPGGFLRLMVYSRHGRRQIERIRDLAKALGITCAAELRRLLDRLAPDHPLRLHFALYGDNGFEAGVVDGFLHACDRGFDALELRDLLKETNFVLGKFLHPLGGRPQDLEKLFENEPRLEARRLEPFSSWERVAALDRLLELESNFLFVAVRDEDRDAPCAHGVRWALNPILRRRELRQFWSDSLYSQRLRRNVNLKEVRRAILDGALGDDFADWRDDLIVVGAGDEN